MTKADDDECPEGGPHEWVLLNFQNLTPGAVECTRCPASRLSMPVKPSTVTTEEAREAAWTEYEAGAEWEPRDRFAARDNFAHGFDAGVAEGIRQAREAVTEEVRTKWVNHPSRDGVRVAVPSERRFVTGWEPIDAVGVES